MSNVVDLFKNKGEIRAKQSYKHDFSRGNVYAKNFVKNTYTVTQNSFADIVKADNIKEARLVDNDDKDVINFSIEANNRVEYFYSFGGKKVAYSEITKVEEIEASAYTTDSSNRLKNMGFNKFYKLYKMNEFNVEYHLCTLCLIVE